MILLMSFMHKVQYNVSIIFFLVSRIVSNIQRHESQLNTEDVYSHYKADSGDHDFTMAKNVITENTQNSISCLYWTEFIFILVTIDIKNGCIHTTAIELAKLLNHPLQLIMTCN